MATQIKSSLPDAEKSATGTALCRTLADLVDLSLVAKQAHWNVLGRNFRSVHLQLDEVVADARRFADEVAERAVAIGVSPDGRAGTVAKDSAVPEHPAGWVKDTDVVEYMIEALAKVIGRVREGIDETEKSDVVSQDLLIEIAAALEKHHWMYQAER